MKKDYLNEAEEFAFKNCKILYKNANKPCTETCMCWGWEFHEGWNEVVKELSVKLEMLNILFKKYGVCVVMDQCKEKFGTLRAYFHVEIESPLIYRIWHKPFRALYYWMRHNIRYVMKNVIDEPSHESIERVEIPSEKVDEEKKYCENISNVKIENVDGKWYKVTTLYHYQRSHYEPTRHKLLNNIQKYVFMISNALEFYKKPSREQLVIQNAVNSLAEQYVKEAEDKCYGICEECGTQIGTEWSPRVETKGWISYICEECDSKRKIAYARNYIEHEIKCKSDILDENDRDEFNRIIKMADEERYFSSDDYKKAEESIRSIVDKISKQKENVKE